MSNISTRIRVKVSNDFTATSKTIIVVRWCWNRKSEQPFWIDGKPPKKHKIFCRCTTNHTDSMGSDNGPLVIRGVSRVFRDFALLGIGIVVGLLFAREKEVSHAGRALRVQGTEEKSSFSLSKFLPEGWHPIYVFFGKRNLITDDIPSKWWVSGVEKNENGQEWFGQHGQDVAVAKFLNFKRGGFFVDLAANDAVWASNTFALETNFDWKGICIEPNPYYWFRLSFRKCQAVGAVIGEKNLDEVKVQLSYNKAVGPFGGIVGADFDNKREGTDAERRYTVSLTEIFETFQAPPVIDYISLDVEGAEEFIMKSFPFHKYKFLTMTIERPKDELRSLLEDNGYKHVMDFRRGDTLWAHQSVYEKGKASLAKNQDGMISRGAPVTTA